MAKLNIKIVMFDNGDLPKITITCTPDVFQHISNQMDEVFEIEMLKASWYPLNNGMLSVTFECIDPDKAKLFQEGIIAYVFKLKQQQN